MKNNTNQFDENGKPYEDSEWVEVEMDARLFDIAQSYFGEDVPPHKWLEIMARFYLKHHAPQLLRFLYDDVTLN